MIKEKARGSVRTGWYPILFAWTIVLILTMRFAYSNANSPLLALFFLFFLLLTSTGTYLLMQFAHSYISRIVYTAAAVCAQFIVYYGLVAVYVFSLPAIRDIFSDP